MKQCGCEWCQDLRNIEPASYIGVGSSDDEDLKRFIQDARERKQFIQITSDKENFCFQILTKCPECGYEFTEEDYDSYR